SCQDCHEPTELRQPIAFNGLNCSPLREVSWGLPPVFRRMLRNEPQPRGRIATGIALIRGIPEIGSYSSMPISLVTDVPWAISPVFLIAVPKPWGIATTPGRREGSALATPSAEPCDDFTAMAVPDSMPVASI